MRTPNLFWRVQAREIDYVEYVVAAPSREEAERIYTQTGELAGIRYSETEIVDVLPTGKQLHASGIPRFK